MTVYKTLFLCISSCQPYKQVRLDIQMSCRRFVFPRRKDILMKRSSSHRLCSGGLRPPILKFSFQNPLCLSCNIKRYRILCT